MRVGKCSHLTPDSEIPPAGMSGIQTNEIKYLGSVVPLSQDRCGVA